MRSLLRWIFAPNPRKERFKFEILERSSASRSNFPMIASTFTSSLPRMYVFCRSVSIYDQMECPTDTRIDEEYRMEVRPSSCPHSSFPKIPCRTLWLATFVDCYTSSTVSGPRCRTDKFSDRRGVNLDQHRRAIEKVATHDEQKGRPTQRFDVSSSSRKSTYSSTRF